MRQYGIPNLAPTSSIKVNARYIQQTVKIIIKILRNIYVENESGSFRHFDAFFDRTSCRSCCTRFLLDIMKRRFYNTNEKLKIVIKESCHKIVCTQH